MHRTGAARAVRGCPPAAVSGILGPVCGRYAASAGAEEVREAFAADVDLTGGALRPTYNAAPTTQRAAVVTRLHAEEQSEEPGRLAAEGPPVGVPRRELRLLTWGLVPSWSKDPRGGARMINARAESVLERPAYRRAAASRRCLVPADGWYEWRKDDGAERKQPYLMRLRDGGPLALAGLYEFWRPKQPDGGAPAEEDDWLVTFAVLTRDAETGLSAVHERMPLVLPPDAWADWLDPGIREPADVAAQLDAARALAPGRFSAVPVGTRVGSVREDDADLLTPVGPPLEV